MFDTFLYAFNAVTPMLLLMLLGWGLKAAHFFDDELLRKMNTFTFRFGISAMMFRNVYTLSSLRDIHLNVMVFVLVSCLVLTGMGWVESRLFTDRRNRRGIIIQNSFRSNFAIIGTTLAVSLGGAAGGAVSASMLAPAAGFGMAFLAQALGFFAVTPAVLSALVGMYGSPVASASAVMAEEMGGDAELARQYVVWTSAFSMITLFLWIFLLRAAGLL